jgi:hypothetical protein
MQVSAARRIQTSCRKSLRLAASFGPLAAKLKAVSEASCPRKRLRPQN